MVYELYFSAVVLCALNVYEKEELNEEVEEIEKRSSRYVDLSFSLTNARSLWTKM